MFLGVRGVLVKSFARIHRDNLINFGIVPMVFANPEDYDDIGEKDELLIEGAKDRLAAGAEVLTIKNLTKNHTYEVRTNLSPRQARIVIQGGLLNYIREQGDASGIEREATAGAHGSTTAMPTKTTKTTDTPGDKPRPLDRAQIFDQRVVETYSNEAAAFDEFGHGLSEKADRRLVDLLSPSEGDNCLDVATGTGNLALTLANRVGGTGKVTAIDLAEGMLEFSTRKARAHKAKNLEFKQMDAQNLQFDDNTFDIVTCGLAIFYFPDIPGTLKEMLRVLKPGGTLGLITADPENAFSPLSEPYMAALRKTASELGVDPPAYHEIAAQTRTRSGLEKLLKEARFPHVQVREESIPVRFFDPKDWWNHGRGSTWGDLVLADMPADARQTFQDNHLAEVKPLFNGDGVQTATPVVFAIAHKEG